MKVSNDRHDLAGRLSYSFRDQSLVDLAMSHRSWCAENLGEPSNERLEFLGDAVIGLAVADFVYEQFPDDPEGHLAKVRSAVVSATALAEVAQELDLGPMLKLGKGEAASGGASKQSILADCMEAVIGAVFLDGGWDAARAFVLELCARRVREAAEGPGGGDFKTRLQEYSAAMFRSAPRYRVEATGPDHAKRFEATVQLDGEQYGSGEGGSKKEAQQGAAAAAWARISAAAKDHPHLPKVPHDDSAT